MMERISREQRKAILKDHAPWVGKPLSAANINRGLQANIHHLATLLLDTDIKHRASLAAAFVERLVDATLAAHPIGPVACGKGCFYCCTTYVSATVPEILRTADALRGKKQTTDRIMAAAERAKTIPQAAREVNRIHCPVLENNACSEYSARPVVCRAVMSKSLESCLRVFTQGSNEAFLHGDHTVEIRAYGLVVMQASLILAEMPHRHYELIGGLAAALAYDDAEEKWLAGEPLFESVPVDIGEESESPVRGVVRKLVEIVRPTL